MIFSKVIQKNSRFNIVFQQKMSQISQAMQFKGQTKIDKQEIVSMMISKFKTELIEPEDTVVKQFDDTNSLFIIAKGECRISI